jgi:hypothetical protein
MKREPCRWGMALAVAKIKSSFLAHEKLLFDE